MDYQRNGWFRPTCGVNRAATMPQRQQSAPVSTPPECCENYSPLKPTSLAMVYSPLQAFVKLYDPPKALMRGTLFAELDKPFTGKC